MSEATDEFAIASDSETGNAFDFQMYRDSDSDSDDDIFNKKGTSFDIGDDVMNNVTENVDAGLKNAKEPKNIGSGNQLGDGDDNNGDNDNNGNHDNKNSDLDDLLIRILNEREQDNAQTSKEDTPLIEKKEMKDLLKSVLPSSPNITDVSAPKTKLHSQHSKGQLELIYAAEDAFLKNTVGKVDKETKERSRRIAKAIFLDDASSLTDIFAKDPRPTTGDIQRRILEAVELNSLKCLQVLCGEYKRNRISTKEDVELFHRRYGLSFWPLDERAKMTAIHLLAKKFTSIKAMEVMLRQPEFLNDFSEVQDSDGSTPLLLAIKCNSTEIVKPLLPSKPEKLNERNQHESPICVAALNDHADVIKEIINKYSKSNEFPDLLKVMKSVDGNKHSILYVASLSGKPDVLDLLSEKTWCRDLLAQEKMDSASWKTFVGNVCAAGCYRLAKIIFEEDRDLLEKKKKDSSDDYETMVTPLMRAAEANRLSIVNLIFDIKADLDLFTTNDEYGRNVFHYAVKSPDVLSILISHYEKLTEDYEAINKMDNSGDTPIMLAANKNIAHNESFRQLSMYTKKVDLFSARFVQRTDMKTLEESLAQWKQRAEKMGDEDIGACLLRGDHLEYQPFLEAARKGNIELMEFFLEHGANHLQRTAKDQTALHCAVLSGKLPAVEHLLKKEQFLKMIDCTDENNTTAASYAAQTGNAVILRCLLEKGAKMKKDTNTDRLNILDSTYGYFKMGENSMKEIISFCKKGKKKSKMLKELFEDSYFGADRIMSKLIEETPDVAMQIFDVCVRRDKCYTHRSYGETKIKESVSYCFFPFRRNYPKGVPDGKLEAIKSMVKFRRDDCLGHPLVIRYLNRKICTANVQTWLFLNFLLYTTFLLTLTAYGAIQSQGLYDLRSPGMIALSVIILVIGAIHFTKEIFQIVLDRSAYAKNFENYFEWLMYVCAVVYVVPQGETKRDIQIAAGAISMFLGWINFSLFLKGFTSLGIYIIMAKRVFLTVCKVLPLVVLFTAAYSFSFSLLSPSDQGFNSIPVSLLTTFVMMTGEIDYRDTFLASSPLHALQKIFLVLFILMISIAIMNLLTGLAVDDTNEIMKRSKEEKRMNKAQLVLTLEKGLHDLKRVSPMEIRQEIIKDEVPDLQDKNSQCSWFVRQWRKIFDDDELEEQLKALIEEEEGKDDE